MACPAQWDAWDEEGNYYYLRYRHGCGAMIQYKTEDWLDAPYPGDVNFANVYTSNPEYIRHVAEFEYGDPLDGDIELDDFARLADVELDPKIYHTNYGDHLRDELIKDGLTIFLEGTGNPLVESTDEDTTGDTEGT
jgi:hypothetical protein